VAEKTRLVRALAGIPGSLYTVERLLLHCAFRLPFERRFVVGVCLDAADKTIECREESVPHSVRPSPNDPRWQLARRIAASKSFEKSSFLSVSCSMSANRTVREGQELNEHQIGVKR